ncbi:copper transport protein ctr6-like [Actinia tenebrosa]|uniref:Copper transport protein n=1 Tax=Actinia tenebrosa TaxID=6105 RepID=A0A6P8IS22_ACTTE|nr:copper transport protein ctr6-like [Actinia tenebrosa]
MEMYFSTHFEGVYVLFKGWKITSVAGLVLSVVIVFVFAVIFEILKAYVSGCYSNPQSCEEEQPLIADSAIGDTLSHPPRFDLKNHLIKTFFLTLNIVYGYILMLVAMTFNVWLFLALVIGYGFGYWFSQPHFEPTPVQRRNKTSSYGAVRDNHVSM